MLGKILNIFFGPPEVENRVPKPVQNKSDFVIFGEFWVIFRVRQGRKKSRKNIGAEKLSNGGKRLETVLGVSEK